MPVYVSDLLGSPRVELLGATAFGAYLALLMRAWQMGPLPDDARKLAALSKAGDEWSDVRDDVLAFFELTNAGYVNDRLEHEYKRQLKLHTARVEGGKLGADRRWRDGTPNRSPNGPAIGQPMPSQWQPEPEPEPEPEEEKKKRGGNSPDPPSDPNCKWLT